MQKILGQRKPIGGKREQGAEQPDVVQLLYEVPRGPTALEKATVDNCTIYCSNHNGNEVDYIGVRTHRKEVLDNRNNPNHPKYQEYNAIKTRDMAAIVLYKEIKPGEILKLDGIKLSSGDTIRVYSNRGFTSFTAYGDEIFAVEALKEKVIDGSASASDKQMLALLNGGVYVVQTNTNNCNC